jgi:exonuclease SbcC
LRTLSEERYAFVLQSDPTDRRKRAGLEIDVWDAFTNDVRSVRTLSAGEKLLASLSLALGGATLAAARPADRFLGHTDLCRDNRSI